MEVQDIQYDGFTISARILVSPEGGSLRLDRRLIPSVDVSMGIFADCERGSVPSIQMDRFFPPPNRAENLMVLEPGYWYGTTVHFRPFDDHITGIGPECVEATLRLHAFDGSVMVRERIRAVRPPSPDGGTRKGEWPEIDWDALEVPPGAGDAGALANPPGSR